MQRYEALWEAGLVPESPAERRQECGAAGRRVEWWQDPGLPGVRMDGDHRRVLATGIARLRTKIQYRPVVFELMPEEFTLGQLQACVEALAGQEVHTQNFRRVVEQQQLVEETGPRRHRRTARTALPLPAGGPAGAQGRRHQAAAFAVTLPASGPRPDLRPLFLGISISLMLIRSISGVPPRRTR